MRYTEAKLTKFGLYLLEDLNYETVDLVPNYDGTEKEPKVLAPNLNLIVNGTSGIAVGMSTSIPPHNLNEVINAVVELIKDPEMGIDRIMEFLPSPDFPTGGQILEGENLREIYEKGEGTIYTRSKVEIISSKKDGKKDLIIVKEIPYKVDKSKLVFDINQIIKNKTIEGLKNISDYSNYKEIVNIHIKFDSNYDGEVILNQLYKSTTLQNSFSIKMRALVDDQPRIFSLKQVLQGFIDNRDINIQKKAQFIFDRNQKDLFNLEAKRFIIKNYQEIAEIIKSSDSEDNIKESLKARFSLENEMMDRILDTPSNFRQFTKERQDKLGRDIETLELDNSKQELLINSKDNRREKLVEELEKLREEYKDNVRRTVVTSIKNSILEKQLIPHENRLVILSKLVNKKENKVNNFLTNYQLDALESTNIPSSGKELKTRGDN
jgi:DNA gyrase subunit A